VKRFVSLFTVILLIAALAGTLVPRVSAEEDTIAQMIGYYQFHGSAAHTDIARLTKTLAETDAEKAQAWDKIMTYWEYVNDDMKICTDVLPDGLPNDDTLCITVLGYALNADGTMKEELIGRLQVAIDSAEKYPNAYVACTGGGTASGNPFVTEADQMAAWLVEHGLDSDRIIVENQSKDTVQNAKLTYQLLRKNYPQITNLAIVTSDYHVPRGCLLYNAQLILSAYEAEDLPVNVVGHAGYRAGHSGYESVSLQASGIAQIAGITLRHTKPVLSELVRITVQGETEYLSGESPNLQVTAYYNNDFSRDVTNSAEIIGYDPDRGGTQTLIATYEENGKHCTAEITVTVTVSSNIRIWVILLAVGITVLIVAGAIIALFLKRQHTASRQY